MLDNKPGLYFTKKFQFLLTSEHGPIAIEMDLKDIENKLEYCLLYTSRCV